MWVQTLLFQALVALSAAKHKGRDVFDFERCKFLDLTHTLRPGIPRWGDSDMSLEIKVRGSFLAAKYVEANEIGLPEHFGTHADAPSHFFPKEDQRLDKVELSKFIGPACVFDISEQASTDRNYGLSLDDVKRWEDIHGPVPRGCIALVYSGWEFKWHDLKEFIGTNLTTDLGGFSNPGMSPEAAEYLVKNRRIKGVGLDSISIDTGSAALENPAWPTHLVVLGHNLPGYENLNNLHQLPPVGATVALNPMKIGEGSGGPIRGWAIGWDGPNDPCRRHIDSSRSRDSASRRSDSGSRKTGRWNRHMMESSSGEDGVKNSSAST